MQLLPADYVLCGLVIVMALLGMFRGFSGTLAFVVGLCGAGAVAAAGWPYTQMISQTPMVRGASILVLTLLAFGLVRLIVKRCVNGLLAQPTDAIFGLIVGVATGVALIAAWAYSGFYLEYSVLASELARYVR